MSIKVKQRRQGWKILQTPSAATLSSSEGPRTQLLRGWLTLHRMGGLGGFIKNKQTNRTLTREQKGFGSSKLETTNWKQTNKNVIIIVIIITNFLGHTGSEVGCVSHAFAISLAHRILRLLLPFLYHDSYCHRPSNQGLWILHEEASRGSSGLLSKTSTATLTKWLLWSVSLPIITSADFKSYGSISARLTPPGPQPTTPHDT